MKIPIDHKSFFERGIQLLAHVNREHKSSLAVYFAIVFAYEPCHAALYKGFSKNRVILPLFTTLPPFLPPLLKKAGL
jgi:hypothetical protein